jgi:hypothetical protein
VSGCPCPNTLLNVSIDNLGSTYRNQGRWKEAEDLFVQVMETRKRVLRQEHPSTLTSIANLASIFSNQGRWKEAEDLFVQVIMPNISPSPQRKTYLRKIKEHLKPRPKSPDRPKNTLHERIWMLNGLGLNPWGD